MANAIPIYLSGGSLKNTQSADTLTVNDIEPQAAGALTIGTSVATSVEVGDFTYDLSGGIDLASAGTLSIGTSTATEIDIGSGGAGGVVTKILGDLEVSGNETVVGTTSLTGNVDLGNDSGDLISFLGVVDTGITFSGAQSIINTTGDMTIQPEDTTVIKGGLGVDLTFTNYTTNGTTLTGTGTLFTSELEVGDAIEVDLDGAGTVDIRRVSAIASDTSLTVNAAFTSNVGPVTHDLNKDDNLLEVQNAYGDSRLLMSSNGAVTLTRGATDEPVLTITNEEDGDNAAIYVVDDDCSNIASPAAGDLALSTTGSLYWYTGATWAQAGSAAGNSLQLAYDQGNSITTNGNPIDFTLANGDFLVSTSSSNEFTVDDGANNYLTTDHDNDQLELGSANTTVGFIGKVDTNVTFETSGGAKSITTDGTNGLTVSTSADAALTLTSATAATWSTTAGLLTLDGASGVTVQGNASTIQLDTTGAVDIDGDGGVTVDAISNNITLTTTTSGNIVANSAGNVDIDGANVNIDGSSNIFIGTTTDHPIYMQSTTLDIDASDDITVDVSGAGHTMTLQSTDVGADSDGIILQTVTTGHIVLHSIEDINIDGDTNVLIDSTGGGVSIGAAAASDFTVTDAGLTLQTIDGGTGGDITISANGNTGTGIVDINADDSVQIDGADASNFTVTGANLTLSTADSGTAGGNIIIDAVLNGTGGSLTLTSDAVSSWTVDSASLTLQCTTAGNIVVDAAAGTTLIDSGTGTTISADAGGVTVDPTAGAITLNPTAGNVDIDAASTYDISLTVADNAGSDITFQAHGSAVYEFNEDGTNSDLVGFTATSLIGALNELKNAESDVKISVTSGEAFAIGDSLYLSTADGKAYKTDADASASSVFIGVALEAATAADQTKEVVVAGEVTSSTDFAGYTNGDPVYVDTATAGGLTDTPPSGAGDTVLKVGIVSDQANDKFVIQVGTAVLL